MEEKRKNTETNHTDKPQLEPIRVEENETENKSRKLKQTPRSKTVKQSKHLKQMQTIKEQLQERKIKYKTIYNTYVEKQEHKIDQELQYEFLPSALEIIERPSSKTGKRIIYGIFYFLILILIWSVIGKVDEVAVARGKIVPDGRIKVVQPMSDGIITEICVDEGEHVKQGQVLMEMDTTLQEADQDELEKSLNVALIERTLLEKTLAGEDIQNQIQNTQISEEVKDTLLNLNESRNLDYKGKQEALTLQQEQAQERLLLAQAELRRLERQKPLSKDKENELKKIKEVPKTESLELKKMEDQIAILEQEESMQKKLYEAGAIAKQEWLNAQNAVILAKKEYETQKAKADMQQTNSVLEWQNAKSGTISIEDNITLQKIKIEQAQNDIASAEKELENLRQNYKTNILNLMVEKDKEIQELSSKLEKAKKIVEFQTLESPTNGTVQGIASNTIGGVLTKAQTVMTIVPDNTPLIIEAYLNNKDIGFVKKGQEVRIKLDAFSYQKYGTINGKITKVSPDAYEDEKMGLVYKISIQMEKSNLKVEGQEIQLSPGMAVVAEIKTGKRRIIEFFLEPVLRSLDESITLK